MPRRVEDMIPGGRRTVRDIPVEKKGSKEGAERSSSAGGKGRNIPIHRVHAAVPPPEPPVKAARKRTERRPNWIAIAVAVVILAAIAAYVSAAFFSRASFSIVPVSKAVAVDATIVASGTSTPGYAKYQTISVSGSASTTVPAGAEHMVSTKATGKVRIYNAYSSYAQTLIAGTRLAGDSGLVYRLTGSVIVPGYTRSGGATTPGSALATIIADQPGASYDISGSDAVSDMRVVAWKGTSRYNGFYARLASDVSGGLSGMQRTIDPATLASTTSSLKASLVSRLSSELEGQVPEGYVLFPATEAPSFSGPDQGAGSSGNAEISVSGTLYGAIFKISDLIDRLAGSGTTAAFAPYSYQTNGLSSLSFTVTNLTQFSPENGSIMVARAKGNLDLVGVVPTDEIRTKLAGLPLSQTAAVLRQYSPVIDVADSSGELFPSWASAVPMDQGRIDITVKRP